MPIRPRSGTRFMHRQRNVWSSSSSDGFLKLVTSTPCGFKPDITCLIAPSLPAASIAWKMTSTLQESLAQSSSCIRVRSPTSEARIPSAISFRSRSGMAPSPAHPGSWSARRNFFPG